MNTIRVILSVSVLLASATFAHARSITISADDGPERVAPRQQSTSAKQHLSSTNGWSEMMLSENVVYLQLTDYGMKEVVKPQDPHEKAEGFFESVLTAMTLGGVKQLLDHSIALSLVDTRSALVRDGEVIFVTCQGKEVFNKVKLNDQVQKFPQQSAEDFVKNVNRLRAKLPACPT